MRRALALAATVGMLALSAVPALAAEGDPGKVMVMKHACTEQPVKDQADFDAIVDQAEGDEITALALTVLACPTIVLTGDEENQTDGIAGAAVDFEFELTDANGDTQTLADATFVDAKLCETDIERDANGDGEFSEDVCLDISHYMFENVAVGEVTIEETSPPNGWKFGTILLTPQALQAEGSDDAATGADFEDAVITLDLAADEDDDVMVHVYNFEDSPATDTESIVSETTANGAPVALAGLLVIGMLGALVAVRRRGEDQA